MILECSGKEFSVLKVLIWDRNELINFHQEPLQKGFCDDVQAMTITSERTEVVWPEARQCKARLWGFPDAGKNFF